MNLSYADRASLNITEAAQYLGVSRQTVRRLMAEGELRWFWLGSSRRIVTKSIEEYIELRSHRDMGRAS